MTIIVNLIVWCVVLGLIWYLVSLLPLPAPVQLVIQVLFIVLLILVVLSVFGVVSGFALPTLHL
jgi:hypothetical protein